MMSDATAPSFQRALDITMQMLMAAQMGEWEQVVALDAERLPCMQQSPLDRRSGEMLATLQQHNERLLAHAAAAREVLERELGQHKYNHRALSVYLASSG